MSLKSFNENRSECPVSVLRQVLEELIKETPNDLLSKELWCHSATPGSWWKSIQVYSRSTAVMSMIGYVIGLGDRHLDNLLVNLNTGEVAHIDYNICFEKGQNLRVPERIPFRMTQNLQTALGLTGFEGIFRFSCETVMQTLRRGKETLLTLLETFVYDPLLDWTGNDTGIIASFYGGGSSRNHSSTKHSKEKRKSLEKKMTYRLYLIRMIENQADAQKNQESLLQMLAKLELRVNLLCDLMSKREAKETSVRLHEQAKIYLDESLTLHSETKTKGAGQHPVYTLHDRYHKYTVYNQKFDDLVQSIDKKVQEFDKMSEQHQKSLSFLRSYESETDLVSLN